MKPIVGKARIIGEWFDTDRMLRCTEYELDPPCHGCSTITQRMLTLGDDGLPMPTQDWMIREDRERFCKTIGYELVD